jgi:uncharacterized repeat protein (TIGR01451 family)
MASFTNQATLSYSGGTTTSNIVTGEVVATFSATKTAVTEQYAPGDTVTYVVSILNTGDSPLSALTVSDDLGGYVFGDDTLYPLTYAEGSLLYYLDGVLQAQPAVTAGPPLEITGVTIPAGSNAMLIYETRVTEYAPLGTGGSVTNTASITGESMACLLEASATVPAAAEARLTVSKALSPEEVPCNGELTYTFLIQNSGGAEADAADQVALSDTFDPVLSALTVAYNGAVQTDPGFYTYDVTSGLFATVPGQITVPAAVFTQNEDGSWNTDPGVAVLTVKGQLNAAQEEKIDP